MQICNFYLGTRPDKSGEYPIVVSATVLKVRIINTVGYSISKEKWIQTKDGADGSTIQVQQVKKGCFNSKGISGAVINARLKQIEAEFEQMANTSLTPPTKEYMTETLNRIKGSESRKNKNDEGRREAEAVRTVMDYYDEFVKTESKDNLWAPNTRKCYDGFRVHLKDFAEPEAEDRKPLSFFDAEGKEAFVDYLRIDLGMAEATAQKRYVYLKRFLKWCKDRGYYRIENGAKEEYKPKFNKPENGIVFLTKQEILAMYNLAIPEDGTKVKVVGITGEEEELIVSERSALEKTRDCFCFCCFTGLRYSDMSELMRSNVHDGYIELTTKKTNSHLKIELNSFAGAILDKYKDSRDLGGSALPAFTNQASNRYLKTLGKLCGYNEMMTRETGVGDEKITQPKWAWLTTHCGRRSFVCFALASGIAPEVVMKWTGHKNYETMKPYIAIVDETKQKAMKIFDDNLTNEK